MGSDAWLVVVDMQRVFAEPAGEWYVPRFGDIVGPVGTLVAAYAPRVVFTRFVPPLAPSGAWVGYYERWPFALARPGAPMYDLIDAFADVMGPTVDAPTFSKWTPELAGLVGGGGMLVAGVTTDCCVLSTAIAAADAGTTVEVVAGACAGTTDEGHRQALGVLRPYDPLIRTVGLDEALARGPRRPT